MMELCEISVLIHGNSNVTSGIKTDLSGSLFHEKKTVKCDIFFKWLTF
jgi:hypothetical protein